MSEKEIKERAAFVAAMRQIADLVEGDETLPVPFTGYVQAGVDTTASQDSRFAELRQLAEHMGLAVIEHRTGSRDVELAFGPVAYIVHANPDTLIDGSSFPKRVVPADEDKALIGGGL